MNQPRDQAPKLTAVLEEHGADGIAILAAEPSRLMRVTILLLTALLVVGIAWSFFGHADVIVTAQGRLGPEADERLVYTPIDGRLLDLYVAEGTPVDKGDILARVDAPGAVQLIAATASAKLKLRQAEASHRLFPTRRKSLEQDIKLVEFQIAAAEQKQQRYGAEGLAKLAEEQRLNLDQARLKLEKAKQALSYAKDEMEKHERLFRTAGGGGISRSTVNEKKKEYQSKLAEFEMAENELAEFEVTMNKEYVKRQRDIQSDSEALFRYYVLIEQKKIELATAELQSELELKQAQAEVATAEQIAIDDVDDNNRLRIKAPVAGVITRVASTQIGAKIDPKVPIAGIAPADARMVLHLEILEQDRAFLKEGMPVKLKFTAFPYQRYSFIDGTLEYIAPTATPPAGSGAQTQNRPLVYKGRVSLARDYFTSPDNDIRIPLRYGMTATAEIVVRQRRLIDLALDRLRRTTG